MSLQLITKENSKKDYNAKMYAINQWQRKIAYELDQFVSTVKQSNEYIDGNLSTTLSQLRFLRAKCYMNQNLVDNLNNNVFEPSPMKNFI